VPRTVVIDCFPESVPAYCDGHVIVAVDVIRATTTAITGVALGRRCHPVRSLEHAFSLAAELPDALLVGELKGSTPCGFAMTNSPADLAQRADVSRPMILLSSAGTRLICAAGSAKAAYVACLRNFSTQVGYLAAQHDRVAIIGAGARSEFRDEDQLCCAWIAEGLIEKGFVPENEVTRRIVARWSGAPVDRITESRSADYLRASGQLRDLEFVLSHVDDLDTVFAYRGGEVVAMQASG